MKNLELNMFIIDSFTTQAWSEDTVNTSFEIEMNGLHRYLFIKVMESTGNEILMESEIENKYESGEIVYTIQFKTNISWKIYKSCPHSKDEYWDKEVVLYYK